MNENESTPGEHKIQGHNNWAENRKYVLDAIEKSGEAIKEIWSKLEDSTRKVDRLSGEISRLELRIVALESRIWLVSSIAALFGGVIGVVVGKLFI